MFPRCLNLSEFVGRKSLGTNNLPISSRTPTGRCIRNQDWDWRGIALFHFSKFSTFNACHDAHSMWWLCIISWLFATTSPIALRQLSYWFHQARWVTGVVSVCPYPSSPYYYVSLFHVSLSLLVISPSGALALVLVSSSTIGNRLHTLL